MKDTSSKETKVEKGKKGKIFKIIAIAFVSFLLVCLISVYVLYIFTHKDSNRNTRGGTKSENIALIEKKLVDGFKNTKTTGKFSFRLSDEDINSMLSNIENEDLWKNAESVYYSSCEEHHFYVDLKRKLGVNTRIDAKLLDQGTIENSYTKSVVIQKETMGKLDYVFHKLDLKAFTLKLADKCNFPVSYSDSTFILSPLSFLEYMPNNNVKSYLSELIEMKPQCVSLDNDSLFGFDIDFSLFTTATPSKAIEEGEVNLESKLKDSLSSSFFSSLSIGETKVACSFSIGEINKVISPFVNKNSVEVLQHELTSTKANIGYCDMFVYLRDEHHLSFVSVFSINGYEIYGENFALIEDGEAEMKMSFTLSNSYLLNNSELNSGSIFLSKMKSYLSQTLKSLGNECAYFKFIVSNGTLVLDFNYVGDSISHFDLYDSALYVNYVDPFDLQISITK